jgi:alpha-L-fucosidase 2
MNLWARLHDGDHAYRILCLLLSPERTYPNLFDAHPPFQIDGNFGGTAGIAEMLVQSRSVPANTNVSLFELELLPALPKAWPAGSVQGLRARGGFEVDLKWQDGRLISALVHSRNGNACRLRYGEATRDLSIKQGKTLLWDGNSRNH